MMNQDHNEAADRQRELTSRVHEAIAEITRLANGGTNVPVDEYIDRPSIDALCDALGLAPEAWETEDLERIFLIRDGLYSLRRRLREVGNDAEHSINQLLSAVDRLYADLDHALREANEAHLRKAQETIRALERTPQVLTAQVAGQVNEVRSEAAEMLTQTHDSIRQVNTTIVHVVNNTTITNVEISLFRKVQVTVQRLSASVFAIKMSLEQNVIFQGIIKFLSDGADKVVNELREILTSLKSAYNKANDFISDLSKLVEKGGRFARLVRDFVERIFEGDEDFASRVVEFKIQSALKGGPSFAAAQVNHVTLILAGKNGQLVGLDARSARMISQQQIGRATINSVCQYDDSYMCLGTEEGLRVARSVGQQRDEDYIAAYQENVVSVVRPHWGIVTGSKDGIIRLWTLAGNLTQLGSVKIGRSVQKLLVVGDSIVVACNESILTVGLVEGSSIEVLSDFGRVGFRIEDIALINEHTLMACGRGSLAHINIKSGQYSRFITASVGTTYSTVQRLTDTIFLAGTEDDRLIAVDFNSGAEIGEFDVEFPVKGIIVLGSHVLVYGGNKNSRGARTIAYLTYNIRSETVDLDKRAFSQG